MMADETNREKRPAPVAVETSKTLVRPGVREVALNQSREVFAALQEMNRGLTDNMDPNSEFMRQLRREGGSGGGI
jgi:hypothetical protein